MRVDGMLNGVQVNSEGLNSAIVKDLISRLSPGDVVRAQILDFISNEVFLKLFDSTTVRASVPEDFSGEIGKFANFVVKETLSDRLVLEEVKNTKTDSISNKENADILKALNKLDIPRTEDNIELAKTITENNLPLTKEVFDNTAKMLNAYKDIDIPKAVIMEANRIDATPASVKQLGLLEQGSVSLGNELNELISMLDDTAESLSETAQSRANEEAIDLSGSGKADVPKGEQSAGDKINTAYYKTGGAGEEKLQKNENDSAVTQNIPEGAADSEKAGFNAKAFLKIVKESLKQNVNPEINDEVPVKTDSSFEKADGTVKESSKIINTDKKITSELKNEVEKLFVKLEDVQKEKKVDLEKNIKSLGEKLEKIKEEINTLNPPNKEVLIQKTDNIINQLRFIDDIRSFGYYVPIPLKFNGTLSQADLYVLKRHKNKKINPEDAAIFLALDTVNMGKVETLLLVNKKTISLNMRLEDEKYEDYVKSRFIDLYNILAKKGYKLTDIKYRMINEQTNIFNINKVAKELMSSNSGGVDIRL